MGKMTKKRLGILLFTAVTILTAFPPMALPDIITSDQAHVFAAKIGVWPEKSTLQHDQKNESTYFEGRVTEACKLTDLGFNGVERGDRVAVTSLKGGKWKAKVLSTGQEMSFKIDLGWDNRP